jgi:hypothetical protein
MKHIMRDHADKSWLKPEPPPDDGYCLLGKKATFVLMALIAGTLMVFYFIK